MSDNNPTEGQSQQQNQQKETPLSFRTTTSAARAVAILKRRQANKPEQTINTCGFWIDNEIGKFAINHEPFPLVIKTTTTPTEKDYVCATLQRRRLPTVDQADCVLPHGKKNAETVMMPWKGGQEVTFEAVVTELGVFRFQVDVMEFGGEGQTGDLDRVLATLYTDDFTVKPEGWKGGNGLEGEGEKE